MLIKTPYGELDINEGSINSGLPRETCPSCGQPDCCYQCDMSVADLQDPKSKLEGCEEIEVAGRLQFNGAMDGIESLLLALVPKIQERWTRWPEPDETELAALVGEAVQTAVDACGNNL